MLQHLVHNRRTKKLFQSSDSLCRQYMMNGSNLNHQKWTLSTWLTVHSTRVCNALSHSWGGTSIKILLTTLIISKIGTGMTQLVMTGKPQTQISSIQIRGSTTIPFTRTKLPMLTTLFPKLIWNLNSSCNASNHYSKFTRATRNSISIISLLTICPHKPILVYSS